MGFLVDRSRADLLIAVTVCCVMFKSLWMDGVFFCLFERNGAESRLVPVFSELWMLVALFV